jgi:nucleotide-binding universal stress UspA family protein
MKILIPVDGSRFSEQAIEYAAGLNGNVTAQIRIARVHENVASTIEATISPEITAQIDEDIRTSEIAYLHELAERCHLSSEVFSLTGPVPEAIARLARDSGVELIVMTTHGRGGLSRAWMGSVADRLVRVADTPLILLRPRCELPAMTLRPARHILIPLDGSASSETILEAVLEVGGLADARYTLMNVVPQPIVASREVTRESAAATVHARERSREYLEVVAASLRARGHSVNTRVMVQDNIAAAIVEESFGDDYDMIAMATHGRSGWARLTLGSVTDKVMRSSSKPLLVVRSCQPQETRKSA